MVKFTFINKSQSDVYIKTVLPDFNCNNADFTKGPIHPLKTGEISLKFISAKGEKGRVNKKVMVQMTTDPESCILTFSGMVLQKL